MDYSSIKEISPAQLETAIVEALEKLVGKPCDVQINVLEFVEEEDLPDNEALQFAVHAIFFDRPVTRRAEDFML
ncbi:hypothetical protein [Laribacter hongkongensis]|uniref:hypothetical protein n=1 Tax=Laribacter hongkongensis TaxID=168471 RepID=UPI001EFDA26E|nr:hypothetical protein [Laribacter hongkongensis]MCG9096521.1 hypothetical protein [Laribacter hongkongensis]